MSSGRWSETTWLSAKVPKSVIFLVQEAEMSFGYPLEGVPGHFWRVIFMFFMSARRLI